MVTVVAAILSFAAITLKPYQDKNVEIEKKKNILASVKVECTADDAEEKYEKFIRESFVVNLNGEKVKSVDAFEVNMKDEMKKDASQRNYPVYVFVHSDGSKKYILPVRGKGLWGPIWGFVSMESDFNTIYGAIFSHKGETPGLGAEIDTPEFQAQFDGKQIFNANHEFTSVSVVKGGADPDNIIAVDAISGGTITSNGLDAMLKDCLKNYLNYFKKHK